MNYVEPRMIRECDGKVARTAIGSGFHHRSRLATELSATLITASKRCARLRSAPIRSPMLTIELLGTVLGLVPAHPHQQRVHSLLTGAFCVTIGRSIIRLARALLTTRDLCFRGGVGGGAGGSQVPTPAVLLLGIRVSVLGGGLECGLMHVLADGAL